MKKGLGKGINDIFGIEEDDNDLDLSTDPQSSVQDIEITRIYSSKGQPRKHFEDSLLFELRDSILEHGILQPILVRQNEDNFEVVVGDRRFRASKLAGLEKIPAKVIIADDETSLVIGLVENVQRDNLSPLEEAEAYDRLSKEYKMSHQVISEKVGKSRSTVTNLLRLLQGSPKILEALGRSLITNGHARALLVLKNKDKLGEIIEQITMDQLSVRETEKFVRELNLGNIKKVKVKKIIRPGLSDYKKEFSDFFDTEVRIKENSKGSGKIEIPYKNEIELNKLITVISGGK